MSIMEREFFRAVRYLDGSVTITERIKQYRPEGGPEIVGVRDGHTIPITKEDCTELAKLLMGPVVSESHKVDYALSVNEPE